MSGQESSFETCPCGETIKGKLVLGRIVGKYKPVLEPISLEMPDDDDDGDWWWTGTGDPDDLVDECHVVNFCPNCGRQVASEEVVEKLYADIYLQGDEDDE